MDQPTHAWLAVEAYRKVLNLASTDEGKKRSLGSLAALLGEYLQDVVVAAWLPDALIKDMMYGHVFKNSAYKGSQVDRFILSREDLAAKLPADAQIPKIVFPLVDKDWWAWPYRVKESGGHLPARVTALCQAVRDILRMGDDEVIKLTGEKCAGATILSPKLRYTPRDAALMFWLMSHYVADAHMPFHCDNRGLASTAQQKTHGAVEDLWGKQLPLGFHASLLTKQQATSILKPEWPKDSHLEGLEFGKCIPNLKSGDDPWKESVYICRASFATSFAWVPAKVAKVDSATAVSLENILTDAFCGEERFWAISKAIMQDAVNAIARFWVHAWCEVAA